MSVSVSRSLAYVEQGRSTCNFNRSRSVELFASQRVSVGAPNRRELCHSLASSLAKSIENHRENRSKIDPGKGLEAPKIEGKSIPGRSRDTPWHPRASRRRLGSVSGASWGIPGAPWERPESPQGALRRQGGRPRASGSAPRRPKSMPGRVPEQKN